MKRHISGNRRNATLRSRLALSKRSVKQTAENTTAAAEQAEQVPFEAITAHPDFQLRQGMAEVLLGESMAGWWLDHMDSCCDLMAQGKPCTCNCVLWFRGMRRTVCVFPTLETAVFPIH